jgi:hypothetical protein
MPCFTSVPTKFLSIETLQTAAQALGIKLEKHNANSYTLRKGNEYITIQREDASQAFSIRPYSGSNRWDTEIMKPLTVEYTKETVKAYYKSKGYKVSTGKNDKQLVFTKYQA